MKGTLKLLAPLSSGAIVVYLIARVSSCGGDPSREVLRQIAERDAVRLQDEAARLQGDMALVREAARKPNITEQDLIDLEVMHGFLGGTKAAPPGNAYKEYINREHERQRALHAQSGRTDQFHFSSDQAFEHFKTERAKRKAEQGILVASPPREPDELDRALGTDFLYGTKAPAGGLGKLEPRHSK